MGLIKLQRFHLIQFGCFSSRGRRTHPAPPRSSPVKVIGPDGRVTVYHRRVKAEELMKEHACHLVCRSDSLVIGQKSPALSAADELQMGESYFILPSQFFQSVLSFASIASAIAKFGGGGGGRKGAGSLRHFDIHKTDSGKLQIRIREAVAETNGEDEELRKDGILCTTKALAKEYENLVGSDVRRRRPKLERIAESPEEEGEMRLGDSGGRRRMNKDDL